MTLTLLELSYGSSFDPDCRERLPPVAVVVVDLVGYHAREGVAAAGVGPDVWEGYFVRRPLLQKQLVRGLVEEEDAEGPVEHPPRLAAGEHVALRLVQRPGHAVGGAEEDALVGLH